MHGATVPVTFKKEAVSRSHILHSEVLHLIFQQTTQHLKNLVDTI